MKKYCLAVDLVDDPVMIAEYEAFHKQIRPEIEKSIKDAGITRMDIFRLENRLFMIMEAEDDFSFEKKAQMDASNPKVQEWEQLMWKYQQALPSAKPGEKWILMKQIFALNNS
ncbi:L-rhamnose mutarotase [Dyadobacter sediminis]|uniref:L-rhamnose mutarotase n=1 Tax=Dyadobacter sediminis TaxID=1493691 RepID=A0A5R9KF43_9BACT|nr:L-rhamnose mutarotase [Dyadobacter sediminis]TLU94697.1 L-rhamnose mutarotase [Dyadobacter sediminis]GGB88962.1 L-fucose mutarotase [Dyadobacter sediminis]